MRVITLLLFFVLLSYSSLVHAQKKTAFISGKIFDDSGKPLGGVSIVILGRQTGQVSTDSGTFRLSVVPGKAFALIFSFTGFKTEQRNFLLNENEQEYVVIKMDRSGSELKQVVVTDQRDRREAGLVLINPKDAINIPTPNGGIESLIKIFVGSNNELTSQYSVRGGNYDENLIYVNDFEVFRPYLVNNAQQEGLSFINPELTKNVSFYNGGFPARFGDKMSSVLDIQYRKPTRLGGSVYVGLLEQGVSLGSVSANKKFTYLIGARNRTNKNLLGSQETKGNYVPSSSDLQAVFTYELNSRNVLELFGTYAATKFTLIPSFSQQTSSVFSPYYSANLGLDTYFSGKEEDAYHTSLIGLSFTQHINKDFRLKWMLSRFNDNEKESYDITGAYLFGERNFDKGSPDFGVITNPLGAGVYQNYARNRLDITVWNATLKGYIQKGRQYFQWALGFDKQLVNDKLKEWQYQDSAGYSLPYQPPSLRLYNSIRSTADLDINRLSGFIQDNIIFRDSGDVTMQAGVRYNYNTLNNQLLISPRIGLSWKPKHQDADIIYRASLGIYDQPPFYRELRRPDGTLNRDLKAQQSWQASAGFDYNFHVGDRPYRFTAEAYFKGMRNVIPYDIDNVRIRYSGENNAKAYATGIEMRLFGELVKDAESWLSIGFMRTREKLDNAYYYNYSLDSNNKPVDSVRVQQGWVRRPTDRLFTLGLFFQDYLSTNKNFKVYLNMLYGSNLPFNIPGSVKYRNALVIDPYIRMDLGFSVLLLDAEKTNRRSHSPFRNFENIWATLEVFNIIDRANTVSYILIKDFSNATYAVPNRLTPRLLNLKLAARF